MGIRIGRIRRYETDRSRSCDFRKAVIEQEQSDAAIHETMGFWWTGFDRSTLERITELQPGEI